MLNKDERYVEAAPSKENVIDIFKGSWASILPIEGVKTGYANLFDDSRIYEWNKICPVSNKKILELGPLECGHSYMLEKLGASSVTSIESNNISFMKCLIVKDIFDLHTNLLHGDFREYLKNCKEKYDIVLASGVLYHMLDPKQLIRDISNVTDTVFLWTHYYSEDRHDIACQFDKEPILINNTYKAYKRYYGEALDWSGFCGGSAPHSFWLTKDDIIDTLKESGFDNVIIIDDEADHPNGSCITAFAQKHIDGKSINTDY